MPTADGHETLRDERDGDELEPLERLIRREARRHQELERDRGPEQQERLQRLQIDSRDGRNADRDRQRGRGQDDLDGERVREVPAEAAPIAGNLAREDLVLPEVAQGRRQDHEREREGEDPELRLRRARAP